MEFLRVFVRRGIFEEELLILLAKISLSPCVNLSSLIFPRRRDAAR